MQSLVKIGDVTCQVDSQNALFLQMSIVTLKHNSMSKLTNRLI